MKRLSNANLLFSCRNLSTPLLNDILFGKYVRVVNIERSEKYFDLTINHLVAPHILKSERPCTFERDIRQAVVHTLLAAAPRPPPTLRVLPSFLKRG